MAENLEETKKVVLNASVAPEEFDWAAFEGGDVYGTENKAEIEAAYDQTLSKVVENEESYDGDKASVEAQYAQTLSRVQEGEVVEGTVTAITKREVVVNIGYKSEGVIMAPEFRYNADLKVGDKVEVFV